MFVVQLKRPGEDPDLRAFGSRRAAVARFRTAQGEMINGAVEACALVEVDAPDAVSALELAAQGQARVLEANLQDPIPQAPKHGLKHNSEAPGGQTRSSGS